MFKLKNFGIALTLTLVFFLITAIIFPWHLYPLDARKFEPIPIKPNIISFIPNVDIYLRGIIAIFPWLTLSPWPVIGQLRCSETGCLFMIPIVISVSIILFFLYNFFIYRLISFKISKDTILLNKLLKFLLSAWLIFVLIGVIIVYKDYLKPPLTYNTLLKKLQDASKKEPFPDGTKFYGLTRGSCGFSCKNYIYRYSRGELELLLRYENPSNSNEAYEIFLSSFRLPKSELFTKFGCKQPNKIIVDLSRCDNLPYTAEVRYFGFIDAQHKIHVETSWWYLDIVRYPKLIPTFFSYYGKS